MESKRAIDTEDKEPADREKIRPADAEKSIDAEALADTEDLVVICYIYQYEYKQTTYYFMT